MGQLQGPGLNALTKPGHTMGDKFNVANTDRTLVCFLLPS
jgi:hypothetical protein